MSEPEPTLSPLLQVVLDGTATPEQRAQLAALLEHNPALRAEYVRQMRIDALLHFTGGALAKAQPSARPAAIGIPVARRPPGRPTFPLFIAAAAAVVLFGLSLAWWSHRGVEVEVVRSGGLAAAEWPTGKKTRLTRLSCVQGQVDLVLPNGVRLEVVAPVEMQFLNALHVRVSAGQVTADVGDRGKGFVVDTARTQIVDLGTKFGVAVTGAGHTDVVVFQGEVQLFDRNDGRRAGSPRARLVEGEAVRVDAQQQLSRIVNVTSGPLQSAWSTRGDAPPSVIASVQDNLRDPSDLYFYRILAGGMREDALAFVAKRHEWNGLDANGIPAELIGADLVQTIPGDRLKAELEIVVTVSRPAVVYVLHDSRTAAPTWLAENFIDTGARIGLENAPILTSGKIVGRGPGEGNMAPFAVWKHTLPAAGSVKLGPPGIATGEIRQWMYGIAAKPL